MVPFLNVLLNLPDYKEMVLMINTINIRWLLSATIRIYLFNFDVTNCLTVIIPRKEFFEDIINIFLLIIPENITLYTTC